MNNFSLWWRHNGRDVISNHQPHDCLLNHLFRRRSKKISKLRVTGLCAGNLPGTGEFPAQMASNAENVSISWRHHVLSVCCVHRCYWYNIVCLHNSYRRNMIPWRDFFQTSKNRSKIIKTNTQRDTHSGDYFDSREIYIITHILLTMRSYMSFILIYVCLVIFLELSWNGPPGLS